MGAVAMRGRRWVVGALAVGWPAVLALPAQSIAEVLPRVEKICEEAVRQHEGGEAAAAQAKLREGLALLDALGDVAGRADVALWYETIGWRGWQWADDESCRRGYEGLLKVHGAGGADADPALREKLQQARYLVAVRAEPSRAVELFRARLQVWEKHPPADPAVVLGDRENLATAVNQAGEPMEAVRLQREIVAEWRRRLDAADPQLAWPIRQLASFLHDAGYVRARETRELREAALRLLDEAVADPKRVEQREALRLDRCGALVDVSRSLAAERLLDAAQGRLDQAKREIDALGEPGRAAMFEWREMQAMVMRLRGDLRGAEDMQRALLDDAIATFGDTPRTFLIRSNQAETLIYQGKYQAAVDLLDGTIEPFAKLVAADAPDLLLARQNLASALSGIGQFDRARAILEPVIEGYRRTGQDFRVAPAKGDLAIILQGLGEDAAADRLFGEVEEHLARDHLDPINLGFCRRAHARTLQKLGERRRLGELFVRMTASAEQDLGLACLLSVRETFEIATQVQRDMALALGMVGDADGAAELRPRLLGMLESVRGIVIQATAAQARVHDDASLRQVRDEVMAGRERVAGAINGGPRKGEGLKAFSDRITSEVQARDRAEKALREAIKGRLSPPPLVDLDAIARALPKDTAVVLYHRLPHQGGEDLHAFVIGKGKPMVAVPLGDASTVDRLIERWRAAIGKSLDRGEPVDETGPDPLAIGLSVQQAVLAPVLKEVARLGGVTRLQICPEASLHALPLDCLPLDAKATRLVGHDHEIALRPFLGAWAAGAPAADGALLAMGGISYDDAPTPLDAASADPSRGPEGYWSSRWERLQNFGSLYSTGAEANVIGNEIFKPHRKGELRLATGAVASKEWFRRKAPGSRYLHIATHGFFLAQVVGSDQAESRWAGVLQHQVVGLAPMALCGLAFAGANRGVDAGGRSQGLLTAEELAAVDLRACELAVLSACDTNSGLRPSGLGIQSLQTALHAAGVRSTVTSLWKVDDALTKELMLSFYEGLWQKKLPPAKALWEAKMASRRQGKPTTVWAAFVLSDAR